MVGADTSKRLRILSLFLIIGATTGSPAFSALLAGDHSVSLAFRTGHWYVVLGHERPHEVRLDRRAPLADRERSFRDTGSWQWEPDDDHVLPLADHQLLHSRGAWRETASAARPLDAVVSTPTTLAHPRPVLAWYSPEHVHCGSPLSQLRTVVLLI